MGRSGTKMIHSNHGPYLVPFQTYMAILVEKCKLFIPLHLMGGQCLTNSNWLKTRMTAQSNAKKV